MGATGRGATGRRLLTSVRLMIGPRVAGLAVIVSAMDSHLIEELNGNGIPVVLRRRQPRRNIPNIPGVETPRIVAPLHGALECPACTDRHRTAG